MIMEVEDLPIPFAVQPTRDVLAIWIWIRKFGFWMFAA
jgi:hypothetical protein